MNYYINRELSWLKFNLRVLEEANSDRVPTLEKLRFISIFNSNLDEFFMVRAGSLYDRSLVEGELTDNKTGMTARQQLDAIYAAARPICALRDKYYDAVNTSLCGAGLCRLDVKSMNPAQTKFVKNYFKREILPIISPQIIDAKHPFPHLENKRLYVLVSLTHGNRSCYGIVPVSSVFDRVITVPGENKDKNSYYVLSEDVILKYVGTIFKQYTVSGRAVVRITRNADVEVEDNFSDDDIDYRDYVKLIIKRREKLAPVCVQSYGGPYSRSPKLIKYFIERAGLCAEQYYYSAAPLDMSFADDLAPLIPDTAGALTYAPLVSQTAPGLSGGERIADIAARRDIFLSHPYYSMKPYLKLLSEAADDPDTASIKITLYRLSNNSEVISSLCHAAENGHEVTALVELKARFDENNNINWSRRLEESGCHVIYGIDALKVHSKITLITTKKGDHISYTTHIATGNYNEKTAKLYTDVGIITSNPDICSDAVEFFQNMTLGIPDAEYKTLLVAPYTLKRGILREIDTEIEAAREGKASYICIKMNSLTDKEVIDRLVAASKAGVKIDLIVRGICCLLPGIPGETDNIRIRSIVGRFLEHSRIFIFGSVPSERRVYIGSADMMTRNTTRRIEIITPILDKKIADTLFEMTRVILRDNVKSSMLCSNGSYERVISDTAPLDSQMYFYEQAYKNNAEASREARGKTV
ncbi:MAG: polyphosphate kinase 1 [Eubacteriales bacterium]